MGDNCSALSVADRGHCLPRKPWKVFLLSAVSHYGNQINDTLVPRYRPTLMAIPTLFYPRIFSWNTSGLPRELPWIKERRIGHECPPSTFFNPQQRFMWYTTRVSADEINDLTLSVRGKSHYCPWSPMDKNSNVPRRHANDFDCF